ncbi:MAG: hypothetical protein UY40_C0004G0016 [candidate division CPR1 bacterium GW2011_GWC1_49_13]|uniref:Uncharacterized protein n=1 Tax=candidate division CPR1 bacterium GW2011_GWC1_49_13 TaxID=1618342 RepID=A0A0G1XTV6_9BACT|nr:MAG: hypothetical protein UY40_C0004G0016 [candidate division CPR1 bacterium GW2011_GWC1_49_13]
MELVDGSQKPKNVEPADSRGEKGLFFIGKSLKRGKVSYIARSSSGRLMARAETLAEIKEAIERLKKTGNAATVTEEKESKPVAGGESKTPVSKKGKISSRIQYSSKGKKSPQKFSGYKFK